MKLKDFQLLETDVPKGVQARTCQSLILPVHYGGKQGLYEIAVFEDARQIELPGITAPGDTVKGWLTSSDVDAILTKMYTITGTEGKQI
jgi:hypothetical protein